MRAQPPDYRTESIAAGKLTHEYVGQYVWADNTWALIRLISYSGYQVTITVDAKYILMTFPFRPEEILRITKTPGYSMPMPRTK